MNARVPLRDQSERESMVAMLGAVRRQRDEMGGVVMSTPTLMTWLSRSAASAIGATVDPSGFHLARRIMDVGDMSGWRVEILVKTTESDDVPVMVITDITLEQWEDGEHATDLLIALLHDTLN